MRAAIGLLLLSACAPTEQPMLIDSGDGAQNQTTFAGRQAPLPIEAVRVAARSEARRLGTQECKDIGIPDSAFVPVEVTGGGDSEYAVFFAHATCTMGGVTSASAFTGTGGAQIELWSADGNAPRLLFRHSMHGFTPTAEGFISSQHGAFCPGGAGPGMCVVDYRWRGPEDGFEPVSRRLYDYQHSGTPPEMRYDWNYPLPG